MHGIESALHNNILLSVDSGHLSTRDVLVLLDLSTAFDAIDHGILLKCLEVEVDLQGPVLKWFTSYLKDRTFLVGNCSPSPAPIKCGIPQF